MAFLIRDKYPIDTVEQVKIAADYVEKHLTKLDPSDIAVAAVRLEKRASELSVFIDKDWMHNYGRFAKTASVSPEFNISMDMRKEACAGIMIEVGGNTVTANSVIDMLKTACTPERAVDVMGMIADFDKVAGIDGMSGRVFPDPVYTVFGCSDARFDAVKIASDLTEIDLKRVLADTEKVASLGEVIAPDFISKLASDPLRTLAFADEPMQTLILDKVRELK